MTSANETRTSRGYLSCLEGGDVHSWASTGLDVVPSSLFPRAHRGHEPLVSTRRCVWCGRSEVRLYPDGSRWKQSLDPQT